MVYQFNQNTQGLYDPANEKDSCGVACIADISGKKSNKIIQYGLEILLNLEHRGATGSDPLAGDGAGILLQLSDQFFQSIKQDFDFDLPKKGGYGVGFCFMPQAEESIDTIKEIIKAQSETENLPFLGWRTVPTDNQCLSKNLLQYEPAVFQFFIKNPCTDSDQFERKLYTLRRQIEKAIEKTNIKESHDFYLCSLSHRTIVYKGMFIASQLGKYYLDLNHPKLDSAIALVHQRYSTNTFPAWKLAQPFRFLAHNGEINTIQSNTNWAHSREGHLRSDSFGKEINKLFPIIQSGNSDSASYDNYLELLVHTGRSIEQAMTIMTPEAWENDATMQEKLKAYYAYNQCLMEPWDGPASLIFSDGIKVGAALDKNGLRPISIIQSSDDLVIMASESGVLRLSEDKIKLKKRLGSGEICFVDTSKGVIRFNDEIKSELTQLHPYKQWISENIFHLKDLPKTASTHKPIQHDLGIMQRVFRYTYEQMHLLVKPMTDKAEETTYAMGTDTPIAVLSKNDKPFYNYFKQRFAQVTNPAIDPIREDYVMSLNALIGSGYNILSDNADNCRVLEIAQPVLSNDELQQLKDIEYHSFRSTTVSITYDVFNIDLETAIDALNKEVENCIDEGSQVIILSDRDVSKDNAPIPALLATSAVHHYLIKQGKRGKIGLIIESGDVREVHHFACLIGYGASAINPYLVFDSISDMFATSQLKCASLIEAKNNYTKAVQKGLKKIFAKMGISALSSYQGAQIFESVGINKKTVQKYFTGTPTRIEGIDLRHLHQDLKRRHKQAYAPAGIQLNTLFTEGEYHWREQGEYHAYNPETVHLLQQSAWKNDQKIYDRFAKITNEHEEHIASLRGLFQLSKSKLKPIPLEEVEPAEEIVKRFSTGAMSIGSISKEAHETLAIAMNRIGGKSNTGEGGEDAARYEKDENNDLKRSAIKQVASGRFGVTSHYLVNADQLQIKIAQGAKPGEGGQLPGTKVNDYIAKLRHTIPGVTLISPPPHHDIYSIEDLSQLIFDLKNANTRADISVKLVSAHGIGTVAAGVVKAKADSIVVAGYDGGTGASPLTSIKHAGIPWEIGLSETQQTLVLNDLRSQVRIQVDGQIKTGRDVIIGGILGADEFGFATSALIATGCVMMRKCHLNTCPVGIATQDPELRKLYTGKPEHVVNYFMFIANEVRTILAQLGFKKFSDVIGQTDLLTAEKAVGHWKAEGLDFSNVLNKTKTKKENYYNTKKQKHDIDHVKDHELIKKAKKAIENKERVHLSTMINNADRTVGTMLGSTISRKHGALGLDDDTIKIDLTGTAGQSFGAFLPRGVTLRLFGDANDYVGKGLSGGKIIVSLSPNSTIESSKNYIAGNTALYGATSGKGFFAGIVGQRFCVRNSGAIAVVEGAGDHCCEYMTGGIFVSLGETGQNFAAGMSGGIAYVYDISRTFRQNCNIQTVEIEDVHEASKQSQLYDLITEHYAMTKSKRAEFFLKDWDQHKEHFVSIIPYEYRKVIEAKEKYQLVG